MSFGSFYFKFASVLRDSWKFTNRLPALRFSAATVSTPKYWRLQKEAVEGLFSRSIVNGYDNKPPWPLLGQGTHREVLHPISPLQFQGSRPLETGTKTRESTEDASAISGLKVTLNKEEASLLDGRRRKSSRHCSNACRYETTRDVISNAVAKRDAFRSGNRTNNYRETIPVMRRRLQP